MSTNKNTAETLVKLTLPQLIVMATELKVQLTGDEDAPELIDLIIQNTPEVANTEAKPGMLISLRTHTPEARNFILKGRNHIANNEKGGHRFRAFLQNREGSKYSRTYPGVRLTKETFDELVRLDIMSLLPDGSQKETVEKLKTDFDAFQDVLLVRVARAQEDDSGKTSWNNFVMLYVEEKQVIVESVF